MSRITRLHIYNWLLFALFIVEGGCSNRSSFTVESLEFRQTSWDSVQVFTQFQLKPNLGGASRVSPDIVTYTLFTAEFDTLYVGDESRIVLPDKALSDREQVLVEVCGTYQKLTACAQEIITASPKRVVAEYEVTFPLDAPVNDRGEVEMASALQRQKFGQDDWEQIRKPSGKDLSIRVYVEQAPDDHVLIPITRSSTPFSLDRFDGHRDLRYRIQSSIMDVDSAVVMFDLFAAGMSEPTLIAQQRIVLRSKSVEERTSEVNELADRAGTKVLAKLTSQLGPSRAYLFMLDWTYEGINRTYLAEFELHWQDAFRGEWSDLTGKLRVRADGTEGTFQFLRGSEAAEAKWRNRVETDYLDLEPLFPARKPNQPRSIPDKRNPQGRP
ncbi:MAG: hypothetical protein O3B41_04620 [Bacteroidetes bacterium]|nr:hypothetical protein [Bacteroidota bacterium]